MSLFEWGMQYFSISIYETQVDIIQQRQKERKELKNHYSMQQKGLCKEWNDKSRTKML